MTENQNKILNMIMAAILLVSMFIVAREGAVYVNSNAVETKQPSKVCVVIDAGHGGCKLRNPHKHGVCGQ